jgi:fatty acid CoA ligase FadD9
LGAADTDHHDQLFGSRAHYGGLSVDFVAASVATFGTQAIEGFRSFHVITLMTTAFRWTPLWTGSSKATRSIASTTTTNGLPGFETALKALPQKQRQHSVLPLLNAYYEPEKPLRSAAAPTEVFHAAVCVAKIGADKDIPHRVGIDRQSGRNSVLQ